MKNVCLFTIFFTTLSICAQEETVYKKKLVISGSVDTYFRTNLSGPNEAFEDDQGNSFFLNPGTSFANRSGFSIGFANVVLNYETAQVGFVADLVFGPRGEEAVFLSASSNNIVNQLYAYWNVSERVTLTLGNFNTFLGYEVISPIGNFNYSTSYMFSNGPFSHTGLKADIMLSEDVSLLLAVMNSTDFTEINLDGSYIAGAQLGYSNQYLNVLYGNQTGNICLTFQVDYTGGIDLGDRLFMGINATYNDTSGTGFYGMALYPQFMVFDSFVLGLRGEYFGISTEDIDDENVLATTLSANYKIGGLTIIPEVRLDQWSADDIYIDNNFEGTRSLSSFLVAAVYKF